MNHELRPIYRPIKLLTRSILSHCLPHCVSHCVSLTQSPTVSPSLSLSLSLSHRVSHCCLSHRVGSWQATGLMAMVRALAAGLGKKDLTAQGLMTRAQARPTLQR
jgi:hypothetical protein